MATARRSPGEPYEIVKIAAHFPHLPALPAVIQRIEAWTPVLQESLLYLEGSHPLRGTIHDSHVHRHLSSPLS